MQHSFFQMTGGTAMANFRTTNKKQLAARVLCGLLLSTYLTGGFGQTAFADPTGDGRIDGATIQGSGVTVSGNGETTASAWGTITTASGDEATAWGYRTTASGENATAWGRETEANDDTSTDRGDDTVA